MPTAEHVETSRCARCDTVGKTFLVRSEQLCQRCLTKYVSTKVVKRLEVNKVRAGYGEANKKILIPISFGISSLSMLHLLDVHMHQRSQQSRHEGYSVQLLFIDQSLIIDSTSHSDSIAKLKEAFPAYHLSTIPLQDCFTYGVDIDEPSDARIEETVERPLNHLEHLRYVLAAAGSPSSKADIVEILRRRLIDAYAQREGFDYILYGDTTTRLAERGLAETAKGRGGTLPVLNADAMSGVGVPGIYPMRDLLRKELQIYAQVTDPPLTTMCARSESSGVVLSLKDNSIDGLMRQYIESVEASYPSIVANVVRTTAKLRTPDAPGAGGSCGICRAPVKASNAGASVDARAPSQLCYGCKRSVE